MKKIFAFALAAIMFASCKQADSGTITVTNTLSLPVRVEISENYSRETLTLAAGQTVTRDYEHYRSIYLPDETPRARYDESGDTFTIVPLTATTVTLYVTNSLGKAITLVNESETDTADYAIPAGAANLATTLSYYRVFNLAVKGETEGSYTIKKTVVTTTTKTGTDSDATTSVDTTYVLVTTPGN